MQVVEMDSVMELHGGLCIRGNVNRGFGGGVSTEGPVEDARDSN